MEEKKDFTQVVEEICCRDNRYKSESFEFVLQSLYYTQKVLKKTGHVSAGELLDGIRQYCIEQFGPMAQTVLAHWGITKTDDFGNIVFSMIEHKLLSKTETDTQEDFNDIYDFDVVFANVLRDSVIKSIE
jgi:uncharacterized repeat protein (TIGR04138 family)